MATLFPYPQLSRLPWGGGCSRLRIGPRSRTPRGADGRGRAAPHALPGEVGRWIILDGRGASGCLEDLGIAERRPCPVRVRGGAILLVRRLCRRGFRFHSFRIVEIGALRQRSEERRVGTGCDGTSRSRWSP